MKIIFAALLVAFTVGLAAPSFADDDEEARREAQLKAEAKGIMAEGNARVLEALALPSDPKNHCEILKAMLSSKASVFFFFVKSMNSEDAPYSSQKEREEISNVG